MIESCPVDETGPVPSCYVELLGPARLQAGLKHLAIQIPGVITLAELVLALAEACPPLVGSVIDPNHYALVDGYILNRGGRDFLKDPAERIQPGDRLLLMSSSAGG